MTETETDGGDKTEKDMDRADRITSRSRDRKSRGRGDRRSESTPDESQQSQKSQKEQKRPDTDEELPENQPIKERKHDTFYLREDLRTEFNRLTAGAVAEAEASTGVKLGDNRHLRPLALKLGAERINQMDPEEVVAKLVDDVVLDDPTVDDN